MRLSAVSVLITWASTISICAAESQTPNVVFIMVDDLGWSDVGFNGSKVYALVALHYSPVHVI